MTLTTFGVTVTTGNGSLSFTVPAVQGGDKVVVAVVHDDHNLSVAVNGGSSATITDPYGSTGTVRCTSWAHTVDWAETYTGTTLTLTALGDLVGVLYVVRGDNGYDLAQPAVTDRVSATSLTLANGYDGAERAPRSVYSLIGSTVAQTTPAGVTRIASATHPTNPALFLGVYVATYDPTDSATTYTTSGLSGAQWAQVVDRLHAAPAVTTPANDVIAGAVPLIEGSSPASVNLANTRHEAGEQHPYDVLGGGYTPLTSPLMLRSVWYTLTPTATGRYRVRVNSAKDSNGTLLGRSAVAIWTGAGTFPLSALVAYNEDDITDDSAPGSPGTIGSVAYFDATAATTYYVQVLDLAYAGTPGADGVPASVEAALMPAMAGDAFATPVALPGDAGSVRLSTYGATADAGEPHARGGQDPTAATASIWATYTPSAAGVARLTLAPTDGLTTGPVEAAWNGYADVWQGNDVTALSAVPALTGGPAVADSYGIDSDAYFAVTAGLTYLVRVYVDPTAPRPTFANITLSWALLTPPANDTQASAATIDLATPYVGPTVTRSISYDTRAASSDPDYADLYWSVVAGRAGTYTLAHTGGTGGSGSEQFYTPGTGRTGTSVAATAGQQLTIQVLGGSPRGPGTFTLTGPAPFPAVTATPTGTVAFAGRYALTGDHGAVSVDLSANTPIPPSDPPTDDPAYNPAWFTWAPAAGPALVSIEATPGDWQGLVEVYTGDDPATLTYIDANRYRTAFTCDGTSTYVIRIFGDGNPVATLSYWGSTGTGGGGGTPPDAPTDLALAPASQTLFASPGAVGLVLTNADPGAQVDFTLDGAPVLTSLVDPTGQLAVSLPVHVVSAGTHTVTASSAGKSATALVAVATITAPLEIGVLVPTPPPPVQNTVGVRRWVFQDPAGSDVYHVEINPNQMSSPFGPKKLDYAATTAINGQKIAYEGAAGPVEWQFSGDIRSKAHYDALLYWRNKPNLVWLTDHYGRAWLVYITKFEPVPKRSVGVPWRHTYTMSVSIFAGPIQQP